MHLDIHGKLSKERYLRIGQIGCGGHTYANIFPALAYCPVELVAVADLNGDVAEAFRRRFGAERAYTDYREMIEKENLDAVTIVTGYDRSGRPSYPVIASDCMRRGVHAWIEKPPAASCADVERMQEVAKETGKHVCVGLKKMFVPANQKAKELMSRPDFGETSMVVQRYYERIPTSEEFAECDLQGPVTSPILRWLDHLCHPMSLLVYLMGMPRTLYYRRTPQGGGTAIFTFANGAQWTTVFTYGLNYNGGMEHTTILGDMTKHIVIDNNIRVTYYTGPGKGVAPDNATWTMFQGEPEETASFWEPEFSVGQMASSGMSLMGFHNELAHFFYALLADRAPTIGTLEHAWQVTRIYEGFFEGEGKEISLI